MPNNKQSLKRTKSTTLKEPKETFKTVPIAKKQLRKLAIGKIKVRRGQNLMGEFKNLDKYHHFIQNTDLSNLTCTICMQLLLMPFSLQCGHIFCFPCLDRLSRHDVVCNLCPCCRTPIDDTYPKRSKALEMVIKQVVTLKSNVKEKQYYSNRISKVLKQFEGRVEDYHQTVVGDKIDYRLGNHWQVGIVKSIVQNQSKKRIQIAADQQKVTYLFSEGSTHLARYHSFTSSPQEQTNNGFGQIRIVLPLTPPVPIHPRNDQNMPYVGGNRNQINSTELISFFGLSQVQQSRPFVDQFPYL